MSEENAEERARRKREERREEREERRAEQELRRSALRKIAGYLGFADLMAVLMVLATGFSAFATWRTATIAYELLTSSERPYFGVRDVTLDRSHPDEPRIYVDYRNFGHVPADNVRLQAAVFLGGRQLADEGVTRSVGVLSPDVPHHIYLHVPPQSAPDILAGRAKLLAQVSAWYAGSGARTFCYRERFAYMPDSGTFEIAGGSTRCDSAPPPIP
ncbi:MAG TPA: hypothetical protein VFB33_13815 [Candidatus Binataceae bacterium]|jgi:hypothetical protein|nr:hypothetical protein [Candidatus Binataceae bacterium]